MSFARERVMECLDYDPETGVFTWKVRAAHRIHVGDVAGCVGSIGYRLIRLDGEWRLSGRLAFFIVHGRWPEPQVDHINGNRDDNRIANLREVSSRGNQQNLPTHRAGRLCGAHFNKQAKSKPWRARITVNGRTRSLGSFATEQEAHEAYIEACEALALGAKKLTAPFACLNE